MNGNTDERPEKNSSPLTEENLRKREEALREYYYIQELIDKFDERVLKIKSWSITSCGVALGFGVTENRPLLFVLAAFGSLVFWLLEALWKIEQYAACSRADKLEATLNTGSTDYSGPEIMR